MNELKILKTLHKFETFSFRLYSLVLVDSLNSSYHATKTSFSLHGESLKLLNEKKITQSLTWESGKSRKEECATPDIVTHSLILPFSPYSKTLSNCRVILLFYNVLQRAAYKKKFRSMAKLSIEREKKILFMQKTLVSIVCLRMMKNPGKSRLLNFKVARRFVEKMQYHHTAPQVEQYTRKTFHSLFWWDDWFVNFSVLFDEDFSSWPEWDKTLGKKCCFLLWLKILQHHRSLARLSLKTAQKQRTSLANFAKEK